MFTRPEELGRKWCLVDKLDDAVVAHDFRSKQEAEAAIPTVAAKFLDPVELEARPQWYS